MLDAPGTHIQAGSLWLRPDDARLVARGAELYGAHCAACHGAKLEGQPNWRERGPDGLLPAPPHDASGHTWHHPDALLIRITRDGVGAVVGDPGYRSAMPVYRGVLSDEDIVAVLSWIKSRWPADVRTKHDQINARAP
jgi:mono/diheme cytochrome c family protein